MTRPETRKLVTSKEVCEILGISVNNLRQITWRGQLKPVVKKAGRLLQYPLVDVEAYKAGKRIKR